MVPMRTYDIHDFDIGLLLFYFFSLFADVETNLLRRIQGFFVCDFTWEFMHLALKTLNKYRMNYI